MALVIVRGAVMASGAGSYADPGDLRRRGCDLLARECDLLDR